MHCGRPDPLKCTQRAESRISSASANFALMIQAQIPSDNEARKGIALCVAAADLSLAGKKSKQESSLAGTSFGVRAINASEEPNFRQLQPEPTPLQQRRARSPFVICSEGDNTTVLVRCGLRSILAINRNCKARERKKERGFVRSFVLSFSSCASSRKNTWSCPEPRGQWRERSAMVTQHS